MGRPPREWTEDEIEMLGKMPDGALAYQLNIHRNSVINKRNELGIPAFEWFHHLRGLPKKERQDILGPWRES